MNIINHGHCGPRFDQGNGDIIAIALFFPIHD
jgi:hypothetical protein